MKTKWTKELEEKFIELYPNHSNKEIASILNISSSYADFKGTKLQLKKDKNWYSSYMRELSKNNEGLKSTQFKKGHKSHNKGKKLHEFMPIESIEKIKKTQFKKGHLPKNTTLIGYEVLRRDKSGIVYWMIKVEGKRKLINKHRYLWEKEFGEIPKGYVIVYKDGDTINNCNINNLECISREELMLRNSNTVNYPKELLKYYAKISKINNLIKRVCQKN